VTIDAYCHCGISKYLPYPDVRRMMDEVGIERAVLSQHLGEYDNRYLGEVVREHPDDFRAVALADPLDPAWRVTLSALASSGEFRGLRIPRETMLDHFDFCRRAVGEGLILVVDASGGTAECLPAAERLLAEDDPTMVFSHLGYPPFVDGKVAGGRELLALAGHDGVYVALSGQGRWLDRPYSALDEFTHEVLEAFGAERVVWASNYPVAGEIDDVRRDLALLTGGAWGLTESDIEAVTHTNAARIWFQ
jgi:L-fuconolactonase